MGYIYKIYNDINSNIYIGKTKNTIEERWKEHLKSRKDPNKNHTHLYRAMNLYGTEHFFITEIEKCQEQNLNDREKYWINYYNSYYNGYNMTPGGDGGQTIDTQKHRTMFGTPIEQYTLKGEYINTYISSGEAEEQTRISQDEINRCCAFGRGCCSAGGFIWKRSNDLTPLNKWIEANQNKFGQKTVLQFDLNGNFIKEFPSIKAAGEVMNSNCATSTIGSVCNGKRKTAYGYKWKFKEINNG